MLADVVLYADIPIEVNVVLYDVEVSYDYK